MEAYRLDERSGASHSRVEGQRASLAEAVFERAAYTSIKESFRISRPGDAADKTPENRIQWQTDVVAAYNKAVQEGKPLVVAFQTDWCLYCRELEEKVIPSPGVQAFADRAIFVRVNPETDPTAADLVKSLGITGYPAVSVLSAEKTALNEIGRIAGYHPADKFTKLLTEYMDKATAQKQTAEKPPIGDAQPKELPEAHEAGGADIDKETELHKADGHKDGKHCHERHDPLDEHIHATESSDDKLVRFTEDEPVSVEQLAEAIDIVRGLFESWGWDPASILPESTAPRTMVA